MEVGVQDRGQVDNGEKIEERERERKKKKREQTTHAQTCDIMDDMQMERTRTEDSLSHNVVRAQGESVREKLSCEVYLSTPQVGYSGTKNNFKKII